MRRRRKVRTRVSVLPGSRQASGGLKVPKRIGKKSLARRGEKRREEEGSTD